MFKRSLQYLFVILLCTEAFMLTSISVAQASDETVDQNPMNQWFAAAGNNNTVLLRQLIHQKTDQRVEQKVTKEILLDSRDKKGRTALLIATHHNAIEAAKLLIEAGADVNAKDNKQDSPYLYAGAEGKLEILKLTITSGANLKSTNRYGGTALTPAAHHGHVEVVRYLVTTDVDIDQVNNLGWTALLEAVILGNGNETYQEIIKILLDAGADKSISDGNNDTPLDHAKMKQQIKVIKLLEAK